MDSQSFDYWMAQGNYLAPAHQTTVFDMPPELSKVPSLSGSPVSDCQPRADLDHQSSSPTGLFHIRPVSYPNTARLLSAGRRRAHAVRLVPHANDPIGFWFRPRQPLLQPPPIAARRANLQRRGPARPS